MPYGLPIGHFLTLIFVRLTRKRRRALWVIAMCLSVTIFNLKPWSWFPESQESVSRVEEPKGINQIISNELSDLPQTKQMERSIERFLAQWQIKGASLAISKNGRLIYSKGFGYADEQMGVAMDVSHIFRVASVSKLFTAVAIMRLVEDGKLSLDDRVFGQGALLDSEYFSNISDKRVTRITVEHLLRHQGGFSVRAGDPMFTPAMVKYRLKKDPPYMMDDLVRYASMSRLVFEPGKGTRYSNIGYLVLSKIIEKCSGMSYFNYLRQEVLEPAGCYDIHLARNLYSQRYANEVRYYEPEDEEFIPSYSNPDTLLPKCYGGNNIRGLYGAGAIVASPTEMLKFVSVIDGDSTKPDILSPKSIEYMTRYNKKILPIGWMHTNSEDTWWRTGTLSGTSVMLKRQSDGYSWVFVTNTSSWRGARFPSTINAMIRKALTTVDEWPDRDMFEFDQEFVDSLYASEQQQYAIPVLPDNE